VWRELGILEVYIGLRRGTLKERDNLEGICIDGWVILKEILEKYNKRNFPGLLIIINEGRCQLISSYLINDQVACNIYPDIYRSLVTLTAVTYGQVSFTCSNTNLHRVIYDVNIQGLEPNSEKISSAVTCLTCNLVQILQSG
jgi:hypothetical protein